MIKTAFHALILLLGSAAIAGVAQSKAEPQLDRAEVLVAMKRATAFMTDTVSCEGGYVWAYLPDFSRRWGELEAKSTMIWIQPPGTATMGHLFLDAWQATGDDDYYRAAEQVAEALRRAQHPAGGWNYLHDFAGEDSLREWYATVGRNAWRLEEFHYNAGNATFDDGGTAEATKFFLRLYAAKRDGRHRATLERAIDFILESQYPNGAWPQRWPPGKPDYSAYLTFNDDVAAENIETLMRCYRVLGDERLATTIRRAMDAYLLTLQPAPQAGWAMQYTPDLSPAAARSYEPAALATSTTARNIDQLLKFYRWTGDAKFLARIPEALAWLESCRLPPALARNGREFPTFLEVGSNRPLYLHRTGSNATNGRYWVDENTDHLLGHYGSFRQLDLVGLHARYESARALDPAELARRSPLASPGGTEEPPRFHTLSERTSSDRNDVAISRERSLTERARALVEGLNEAGYWPVPLRRTSHPYRGPAPSEIAPGDFASTDVGDVHDTSPFFDPAPVDGISVAAYIRNMGVLIRWLDEQSAGFRFEAINDQSLGLWEKGKPVLVFNHGQIRRDGIPELSPHSGYIHPIHGLDGEVLTDDFPEDHVHHRGLFWAWPHVRVGGREYSLWSLQGIRVDFKRWLAQDTTAAGATLGVEQVWMVEGDQPVMREEIRLKVHPVSDNARAIDVEVTWTPIDQPIALWGAEGKSYGGTTLRFAPRSEPIITLPTGRSEEDSLLQRFAWADYSGTFAGASGPSGAAIFVHPQNPDFPPEWMTRHYGVLAVGWPGSTPRTFEPGESVTVRHRLWIHRGTPEVDALQAAYDDYRRTAM